ncbi:RBBP9/YdeN family alpha/beta hydrolase [Frigidibacter sp. MR17.24]|uniref:RBBP9/YdeN family alpha/beta hydrolase n=1 Tax=Frigidibacter sp. MR17.24 TaxID=3127345 RepID=UPI003012B53B
MTKILLVPGLDGSGAAHWQAWWAAVTPGALLLDWRAPDRPVAEDWEAELAGAVLQHPGALIVGHSLGAVTAARALLRWPGLPVAGALLVAPAEPSRSARTCGFGALPRGRLPVPARVVASRNDPWMGAAEAAEFAQGLGAGLTDLGHAGHINVESGFGPWPAGRGLGAALLAGAGAGERPGTWPGPAAARPVHRRGDRRLPGAAHGAPPAAPTAPAGAAPSRATTWGRCYP